MTSLFAVLRSQVGFMHGVYVRALDVNLHTHSAWSGLHVCDHED